MNFVNFYESVNFDEFVKLRHKSNKFVRYLVDVKTFKKSPQMVEKRECLTSGVGVTCALRAMYT